MLCPLHACCKLPCKEPEFQSKKKKKCELRSINFNVSAIFFLPFILIHFSSLTYCFFSLTLYYRNSCINQPQIAVKSDNRQDALWKSQRKNKSLVLCCSAITDAERVKELELEITFYCCNFRVCLSEANLIL